jgi:ribosomal subunit interface protein
MQIKIESKTFEITPSIKGYIEKRIGTLGRFLKRFEKDKELIVLVRVLKTTHHHRHGEVFKASISLNLGAKNIVVEECEENLMSAIDKAKDRMKENIIKYKEKLEEKIVKNKKLK